MSEPASKPQAPPASTQQSRRWPFTIGQFLVTGLLLLFVALGALFWVVFEGSRRTILSAAAGLMRSTSVNMIRLVGDDLAVAERAIGDFERRVEAALVTPSDPASLEANLLAELIANQDLTDLTLTYGTAVATYAGTEDGHAPGELKLAPFGRGQVSVFRATAAEPEAISTQRLFQETGRWVVARRSRPAGSPWAGVAFVRETGARLADPTAHPTFTTPAMPAFRGQALWSDLSFSQLDQALPQDRRRRVVSVQKALWTREGTFIGVLRAGIMSDRIDQIARLRVHEDEPTDPHRIFVCDTHGRLITRLGPEDRFGLLDEEGRPDPGQGDVRVLPKAPPASIEAALRSLRLRSLEPGAFVVERLVVAGTANLVAFAGMPSGRTQGWVVGITVPESHLLRDLLESRRRFLVAVGIIMLGILVAVTVAVPAIRRGLGGLIAGTERMRRFDFAPARARKSFRDLGEAMDSLERAKTALRAMEKYVPVDLVRHLFETGVDPKLGGRLEDVSIMFTDIESFTSASERVAPDTLAQALGLYLAAMTETIHATQGIVDKYVGDGVMALWNTPRPCPGHAVRACRAALGCAAATAALYESAEWRGLASAGVTPWVTRFGLHTARVTVGHFGAPNRMSFTAMGDGVNLASRLEGLNKLYGTRILASESIFREAQGELEFRRLDRVAVKGKHQGVEVYELVGSKGAAGERASVLRRYEAALVAYFDRRFADALSDLAHNQDDPPSEVLRERCEQFLADPPPPDWDGVTVAKEK